MKNQMASEKFSSEVNSALKFTEEIISKTGPRLTGKSTTHEAAEILKKRMESFCDKVEKEPFEVHPQAFLDWIRISVIFYFLTLIFLWIKIPIGGIILIGLALSMLVLEFIFYFHYIDVFFPKKQAINVVGTIEPTNEIKQQVIISGHHDSAYVFNFLDKNPELYSIRVFGGIGSVVLIFIYSIVFFITQILQTSFTFREMPVFLILNIIFTGLTPFVLKLWQFRGSEGTPGAGDNLISSCIAIEVGNYFASRKQNGEGLNHTRIIIASWDAEEAGLRGARAYIKKHLPELQQIPTFNLNMDCPYHIEDLFFLTTDINSTVHLSDEMAKECVVIAKDLGYPAIAKKMEFLLGGTDAGEFGRAKIPATSLIGMPWGNTKRAAEYHTPRDTIDAIQPKIVEASIAICIEYIQKKDQSQNS